MKRVYRTIEEQVEKCYPKATKEEKAILVERYREMLKGQPIMEWVPESEEEARRFEQAKRFCGVMVFGRKAPTPEEIKGHTMGWVPTSEKELEQWQPVKRRHTATTTKSSHQG